MHFLVRLHEFPRPSSAIQVPKSALTISLPLALRSRKLVLIEPRTSTDKKSHGTRLHKTLLNGSMPLRVLRNRSNRRRSTSIQSADDFQGRSIPKTTANAGADTNFCYATAKRLSLYCSVAYCSEQTIMKWSDDYCASLPSVIPVKYVVHNETDARAFVAVDPKAEAIVVSCSGSASLNNFQTNLKMDLVDFVSEAAGAQVHTGFYLAAKGLLSELAPVLDSLWLKYPSFRTIITGHSLGGGTAMLIALMLQEDSNRSEPLNPIVYTFAEPMVGNAAFVRHWDTMMAYPNSQVFRVTHQDDPILHFNEPMWQSMGFFHRAGEIRCGQGQSMSSWCVVDNTTEAVQRFRLPPLNILAHTKYLGTYVGPRGI